MTVELFGMARALAGRATIDLPLADRLTKSELLAALARELPQLVGPVINEAREELLAPNLLLLDGQRAPMAGERFGASDRPCIVFLASGG